MVSGGSAVVVSGLVRCFGTLRALDRVTFDVPHGAVLALLGHNGAGKTTLLRVLNGLLRPSSGSVNVLGLDPTTDGQAVRARTGVLTEYPALDDFLTIEENLVVYGAMYGLPADVARARATRLLASLDLGDRSQTPTRDLSAGLKQRAALARALLHQPEVLLLDEPTSNLDPLAARHVRQLVAERARTHGTTVVVSTHNLAEAAAIADRVVVLQEGRVLAWGGLDELRAVDGAEHVLVTTDPGSQGRAVEIARRVARHVEVPRTPDSLLVSTAPGGTSALVARLVDAGVGIRAVVPQARSLEDVYVALHAGPSDVPVEQPSA